MKSTRAPLLSALFVSFLLFPCYSAEAAIRAAFENPGDAQPVAGITTIQGWAFETETGSHTRKVTLLIDETLRQDIPCCSERGDIPLAFPAFPAEKTLNSGWAMTFNWGLLSVGVHTLRVEIESTSGQIFSTETRTVTVVKPGDFEFLDQLDLSAAEASILGSQLVLKGVKVRDKASKRTKTVDVRYRWFENSQSLGAIGSATTSSSREPKFVFGSRVSAEDQRRMEESTALAMYYIQDETGLWINDYTIYVFLDRENFLDVFLEQRGIPERERARLRREIINRGDNWASLDYTRTSGAGGDIFLYGEFWFDSNERLLRVIAHEYFHIIQFYGLSAFEAGVGSHDVVYKTGPAWLLEGSAIYVQYRTGAYEGLLEHGASSFAGARTWEMAQARETTAPLQSTETFAGLFAADGVGYALGFMATEFLVENFGGLPAVVSFYEEIGPGTTWQAAFRSTFGISIREFYTAFEAYRLENFPPRS